MNKADKLARAERARALLGDDDDQPRTFHQVADRLEAQAQAALAAKASPAKKPGKTNTRRQDLDRPGTDEASTIRPNPPSGTEPGTGLGSPPTILPSALKPARALPLKWPAPPVRGDLVFYKGERWWVEVAPLDWTVTSFITISDHRVPPGPIDYNRPLTDKRLSFSVFADCVEPVPVDYNHRAKRLPTPSSVKTAERAKAGTRDVGDEVATLLRACADLGAVYNAASDYLGVPVDELHTKYGKLNPGQQRMNLGNRMRNKWKKDHV